MRCCVVRHGETPWNAERRLQGHQDIPLNELGLAQARAAGAYLKARQQEDRFAAVISSDLLRARQTAEVIAHDLGMPVALTRALRERHYGFFEGKTPGDAARDAPLDYAALLARADLMAEPGAAEPLAAMVSRIEDGLMPLVERYGDASVVLVTHGGVLDVMYRRASGRALTGPRDAPIPNAGMNWLDLTLTDGRLCWTLQAWGQTTHLIDTSLDEIL
jgi:2,3-bisphosphoglycerate-dependent phosphoglycerate mutase